MEYIVSNVEISGAARISSNLWIKGNFREQEGGLYLLEGYIVDYHIKDVV